MPHCRQQFDQALTNIEVNDEKRERAIAAHSEIREFLQQDERLKEWGVEPILIGSYSRRAGIYPGKDVDILLRFTNLDTGAEPKAVFDAVWRVIVKEYGQYGQGKGRAQQQARSVKVRFPDSDGTSGPQGDFSIDAVPAVRDGELWAIPTKDQNRWAGGEGRWVTTGAVWFGELSEDLNQAPTGPMVGNRHAYKPMVKLIRQIREVHLGDRRPGGLYLEFMTYEAWRSGLISGDEWDTLLAQTLQYIADRLARANVDPLVDPVLGTAVSPPLSESQIKHAAEVFSKLAGAANRTAGLEDSEAAADWQRILGGNDRANHVFPTPPNIGGRGGAVAPAIGGGGVGVGGGSTRRNDASRFG